MGGNALKKTISRRMNKRIYEHIKHDIAAKLGGHIAIQFLKEVPGKKSFGDVDVLYYFPGSEHSLTSSSAAIRTLLEEVYKPVEYSISGDIVSFAYHKVLSVEEVVELDNLSKENSLGSCSAVATTETPCDRSIQSTPGAIESMVDCYFQVDMIFCSGVHSTETQLTPEVSMQLMSFYFSYGDLGGILGRVLNYYGLKIGHRGLYINLLQDTLDAYASQLSDREEQRTTANRRKESNDSRESSKYSSRGTTVGTVMLSADLGEICAYLGLDYARWCVGFDSREEIFTWVRESRFFTPRVFSTLNCDHRKRAGTRPFYQAFLGSIGLPAGERGRGIGDGSAIVDDELPGDGFEHLEHELEEQTEQELKQEREPAAEDATITDSATMTVFSTHATSTRSTASASIPSTATVKQGEARKEGQGEGKQQFEYQLEAVRAFNKQHELDRVIAERARTRSRAAKFNGRLAMERCGLSQKEVGAFIAAFKQRMVQHRREHSFIVDVVDNACVEATVQGKEEEEERKEKGGGCESARDGVAGMVRVGERARGSVSGREIEWGHYLDATSAQEVCAHMEAFSLEWMRS